MIKTLILTPNKTQVCGMYQLAKDLAKELDGKVVTKNSKYKSTGYENVVISLLHPMHNKAKSLKKHLGFKWIVYDQKVPPVTKEYFPNFFRRQYMKYFNWINTRSMKGADEYWELSEREQKPRWTKKIKSSCGIASYRGFPIWMENYALYLGRTTDYKNFDWLKETMERLGIPLIHPEKEDDEMIYALLSNASLLVTASIWEGYGRPVMEAQALGIPVVCFDTGVHKKLVKNGIVVPNRDFIRFKDAIKTVWKDYDR